MSQSVCTTGIRRILLLFDDSELDPGFREFAELSHVASEKSFRGFDPASNIVLYLDNLIYRIIKFIVEPFIGSGNGQQRILPDS